MLARTIQAKGMLKEITEMIDHNPALAYISDIDENGSAKLYGCEIPQPIMQVQVSE
jgi:hypothetical protein